MKLKLIELKTIYPEAGTIAVYVIGPQLGYPIVHDVVLTVIRGFPITYT